MVAPSAMVDKVVVVLAEKEAAMQWQELQIPVGEVVVLVEFKTDLQDQVMVVPVVQAWSSYAIPQFII